MWMLVLANVNDIYSALHYASSIANAKVAVIDIDKEVSKVVAQEIPFITQYHSLKFWEHAIKIWRYFDIGEGVEVPYSDSIEVISGAVIKKKISLTDDKLQSHISKSHPGRNLCS